MTSKERMTERTIQRQLFWRYHSGAAAIMPNYTPIGWYECDLFIVTKSLYSVEYEIKITVQDFRADARKRRKHQRLRGRTGWLPTRFFYVVPKGLIDPSEVPEYAGLIYSLSSKGRLHVEKEAMRLHTEKHEQQLVTQMWRAAGFRYWNERFKFEDMADQRKGDIKNE